MGCSQDHIEENGREKETLYNGTFHKLISGCRSFFPVSRLVRSLGVFFLLSLLVFLSLVASSQAATRQKRTAVEAIKVLMLQNESASETVASSANCTPIIGAWF